MINVEKISYQISKDIDFILEAEDCTLDGLSNATGISRMTLHKLKKGEEVEPAALEKFYSYAYERKYRLNSVKEDLLRETWKEKVLFHGSKYGLETISSSDSRKNCDFGNGFYLGETYTNALSFVSENPKASVYTFLADLSNLRIVQENCTLEWMLGICYYRGTLKNYASSSVVQNIVKEIETADVVIAPIAENKMFYVMSLFTNGDINADMALHSLAASKLGMQYIFKTEKAIDTLQPKERYYLCDAEKKECSQRLIYRSNEIETKLKLAKREYRNGLYIEELLKNA